MFTFVGETVLDPFLGSGTTALAARNLGRNSVGYEINPAFLPVIRKKLHVDQGDLGGTRYEFLEGGGDADWSLEIGKLPYIFIDPHKLDKKVDPKKRRFGSKIDSSDFIRIVDSRR
jgi:site-specific DNA-methyltransferase (adenine-specific)